MTKYFLGKVNFLFYHTVIAFSSTFSLCGLANSLVNSSFDGKNVDISVTIVIVFEFSKIFRENSIILNEMISQKIFLLHFTYVIL